MGGREAGVEVALTQGELVETFREVSRRDVEIVEMEGEGVGRSRGE
jgi:hypothetical protein